MTGLYRIVWKNSAKKELKKLDRQAIPSIISAVSMLAEIQFPNGVKKLQGSQHTYRIRVGDYRIVYSVEEQVLLIEIIRIGHRKEIYRKFT